MIEFGPEAPKKGAGKSKAADDYDGFIPIDLRDFYSYNAVEGHCIRIIPRCLSTMQ